MTMDAGSKRRFLAAMGFVVFGVLFRLVPHPDNFTPVMAIALFSGATLPLSTALFLPLIVMIVSDLLIGPHALFAVTWGAFFLVTLLGTALGRRRSLGRVLSASAAGSLIFFVLTNLGVFFLTDLYPRTWAGLGSCYLMALPFFRNALAGDFLYALCFFGAFHWVCGFWEPARVREPQRP